MVELIAIVILLIVAIPLFKARRFAEIDKHHELRRALQESQEKQRRSSF